MTALKAIAGAPAVTGGDLGRRAGRPVTVERLVELIVRSLTAEHEVADLHRALTVHTDRVGLVVGAADGTR
jgi:hypothetical protein